VELPIGLRFESLGYTAFIRKRLAAAQRKCKQKLSRLATKFPVENNERLEIAYIAAQTASDALFGSIEALGDAPPTRQQSDRLFECLEQAIETARELSAQAEIAMGDPAQVGPVAYAVYSHVFASDGPPAHVLLRDYARGVIEYAVSVGCKLDVEMDLIRPPYKSEPLADSLPSWEELKRTYDEREYLATLVNRRLLTESSRARN